MTKPTPPGQEPVLTGLLRQTSMVLYTCLSEMASLSLQPMTLSMLDTDDEDYLRRMPEGDRFAHLQRLLHVARNERRESDIGLAQTELDALAHAVISDELKRLIPGSLVAGEEASEPQWDVAMAAPPGTYIWILDAIDGSGPQDTLGFGYSSNVILYVKQRDGSVVPVMSVMVTSSSVMLGWITPGRVGAAHLNHVDDYTGEPQILELIEPLIGLPQVRHGWVAVVAAQPAPRASVFPLFTNDRWVTSTLGGAPALAGLLLGRLDAVVIPTQQTRHDAAPLLALASGKGIHFIDLDTGFSYSDAQVRSFFMEIQRPRSGRGYKPVPAMVVARDFMTGVELAEEIRAHRDRSERENGDPEAGGSEA